MKTALAERMLKLDVHLGDEAEQAAGNHRNGTRPKTVGTGSERVVLDIPRDRHGRFDPVLITRYQRRFPRFDDKIIAMYACGMSTRDIQAHIEEIYGIGISPELVSRRSPTRSSSRSPPGRTGRWRRPTRSTTSMRCGFKIRDECMVRNKAVYLAIGIDCGGEKDVLGLWIEQTEGAKFWLRVMNDLKTRGTHDVLFAVVDGLKGFPEAIIAVFPECLVQTCIVHLIRYSMQFASWKESKALRPIYAAAAALDEFERGPWGQKYPPIVASWRRRWAEVISFFAFAPEVRTILYTTNAIESLHSQIRKAVRNKGHFPSDEAATKLICLALRNVTAKWKRPPPQWHAAMAELATQFGSRFEMSH